MKKIFLVSLIAVCAVPAHPQNDSLDRGRTAAKIAQLAFDGESALWFSCAETGKPLEALAVDIETIGNITTGADGLAVFPTPKDGVYGFSASKSGYMLLEDQFTVTFGAVLFNKYSLPRAAPLSQVKIVLDWGREPRDLDIHLIKENQYHISYRDAKKSADSAVWLDRDDTSGYGPETITITQIDNAALYRLYIHDYSNRAQKGGKRLAASGAIVRVYNENKLKNQFPINPGGTGTVWRVFDIVNGTIKTVDRYE
jgi:hypothetical protein